MEGLTPGRVVHYVDRNGEHLAAVVSRVEDGEIGVVALHVFNPGDGWAAGVDTVEVVRRVPPSPMPAAGTWHWIERA